MFKITLYQKRLISLIGTQLENNGKTKAGKEFHELAGCFNHKSIYYKRMKKKPKQVKVS